MKGLKELQSSNLRQRRKLSISLSDATDGNSAYEQSQNQPHTAECCSSATHSFKPLLIGLHCFWMVLGLFVLLLFCWKYSTFVSELHETNLWFSHIKEVEREISFRTESGLYYSYYKQLLAAPTLRQGVVELMRDNITEHPSTINVLARMNIYQEVVLAAVYRTFPFIQRRLEPVYFYIDFVFALHGLLIGCLFAISWLLSGTWLAGLLTALFYIFNRLDVTRVDQWIPLRENFSLPFLWAQIAVLTVYFRRNLSPHVEQLCRSAVVVFTFLFAITWQFNQFALLLQAMALFGVQTLHLVEHNKILFVYLSQGVAMFAVCVLQFFNPMIITGLLLSFLAACVVSMRLQSCFPCRQTSIYRNLLWTVGSIFAVFLLTFCFNLIAKFLVRQAADEHIYKFILTKFGFREAARDFDVKLYLCNGAFEFLDVATFLRLSNQFVFPIYTVSHVVLLAIMAATVIARWQCSSDDKECSDFISLITLRPELAYHVVQAVFFGAVGLVALRMKFFWTPYMCIVASSSLADRELWMWILKRFGCLSKTLVSFFRNGALVCIIVSLLYNSLPAAFKELEDLREFYDPDTVQLMEWIKTNTELTSSFTGSMQLLAGVKLCTGRPIANHPHYEDKSLRQRTKQLYAMYGRYSAQDVHEIMTKYSIDYVILEDSLCLAPSMGGCRLPDIVDVDSGVLPDSGEPELGIGLVRSTVPRFCDQVRHATPTYSEFFTPVFDNPTFRVYRVRRQFR